MSGTSLDGIDVASIKTDGEAIVHPGPSKTYPYEPDQRAMLREAIAEAKTLTDRRARPGSLAAIEWSLTDWHALAVESFCEEFGLTDSEIDIIGFHGQTVIHRPEIKLTVQLGDGPLLARRLNKPVVYDVRAADVAQGGQGAPLVPAYHRALAARLEERPVAFVNIGGVANVTWIGATGDPIAFDTGPGNALINDWCEKYLGEPFDSDGALATKGKLDASALKTLLSHPYFEMTAPKSLDRNAFDTACLNGLSGENGARTLTHFTAASLARAADLFPARPKIWIVCGGGRHNPVLMTDIRALLEPFGERVLTAEAIGANGDAIEAEAWAYLAVRSQRGLPITWPMTTGVKQSATGGVTARP
jgi:anhydro-N-acetylmuramic acid kinase